MIEETIPMFETLPVYPEDLEKVKAKKRPANCLQEMLLELLETRKVSLADVQKGTNIAWGTLHGWYKGDVTAQLADENLLKLARFFNVSLEYLCFGIGEDTAAFEYFENKNGTY